jgi:hypothetical protein
MLCQRFAGKVIFVVLTFFIATIVGCSGGGKNNPIPPSPPSSPSNGSQENPTVSINASPKEVNSGNDVSLEIVIQNGVPINIEWAQSPSQPAGQFQKADSRRWTWKAPSVSARTTFILTATVTFLTTTRQASTTITVLPSPQPPQPNPPSIQVIYPWEDNKVNVVGDNVILTVKGYVYSRSNGYVNKVEAYIDNEKVAETIPNYDYFELDITKFGNRQGNKQLIIKATTTDNAIGEYKLNIIYDNNLLYSLAVEFIRRYSCIYHENEGKYRIVRFGNLNNGPYNKPVRIYVWQGLWPYKNYIEKACEFWTKYTGIQFQIILQNPTGEEPLPVIGIRDWFDQDPGYGAITWALTQNDPHEIIGGSIALYAGWLRGSEKYKTTTIAHELGHVLLMGVNVSIHTQDNSLMDSTAGGSEMLHTYQQLACKIMYSKNPGDSI